MPLTKAGPNLNTLDAVAEETLEASHSLEQLCKRLKQLKKGGAAYCDLLPEVSVAATLLGANAGSLERVIDEMIELMPSE
jgi:hypothetical protein